MAAHVASHLCAAPPRVQLLRVSKAFGANAALSDVSLEGRAGSIHAVTGENGAGKSTLMKLLAGVHAPDGGEIRLDGRAVRLSTPAAARAAGVSTVFQELTVLPNLSVAENLWLGREPLRARLLDRRAAHAAAVQVLRRVGLAIDPGRACSALSIGEQQMLEIAKGLAAQAQVFIFDEPTAPLNRVEVDRLGRLLRELQALGKLIFYISHRMEEIFRFCDTVSVLKDGRHVTTQAIGALDERRLVALMVGRELQALFPPRRTAPPGKAQLQVDDLRFSAAGPSLSFALRGGEVVGIAGLEGQGQRELLRTLAGATKPAHGTLRGPDGAVLPPRGGPRRRVRARVALMPEDRKGEGLYLDLPIEANLGLGPLRAARLWQRARREPALMRSLAERLRLRAAPSAAVGTLSGGNQQKVMLGRWLAAGVQVLLVEQPTRGVDVAAKAEIYALLRRFADDGGAVLAVSGDLPELIGLCDRILVMRASAVVADVPAAQATEESLLSLALQEPWR